MTRFKVLAATVALAVSVTACDSLKEAFTAHVDTVARAQGQELSTERLATLMGNSTVPVRKDIASVIADFWISYQLVGYAAAHGDGLPDSTTQNWWVRDNRTIDDAMWAAILTSRAQRHYENVANAFPPADTTQLEQKYAQGDLMAAQHILFLMPEFGQGLSAQKQDSIRRRAEDVRRRVTPANFNEMASQYTEEPGGKERRGHLGVFPRAPRPGSMVPEFEAGVKALQPGEVSPALVQTSFGFHIIRRNLLPEVREEFIARLADNNETDRRDAYITKLREDYRFELKPTAVATARKVAESPTDYRSDRTVLATSRVGDFSAARLSQWIEVIPPQMQIRDRLAGAPDTVVGQLLRAIVDQEIIGAEAEKAGASPDSTEMSQLRSAFSAMVRNAMFGLRVDPASLGDSARTATEKERLAAVRVNDALEQLFSTSGANFVEVPVPVAQALRKKYSWRVTQAGLDRAIEKALVIRAAYDSARAGSVPMPTMPGGPPPGGR